jgi:cytoskeleton protein RodZ
MSKAQRLSLDADKLAARRRLHLREISDGGAARSERVGGDLRAARINLGYDIGAVADALRIRRDHLEAVEDGDMTRLPGRAYAVGFVRSYAEYLGLDADECVRRFKEETREGGEGSELVFPEASEELQLPHGVTVIALFLVFAFLVWGIFQLTVSGEKAVVEEVPPVPDRLAADGSPGALDGLVLQRSTVPGVVAATNSSEPLAAALPPEEEAPSATIDALGIDLGPRPERKPAVDENGELVAERTLRELAVSTGAAAEPAEGEAAAPAEKGTVHGAENGDARIVLHLLDDAWIRVEDLATGVLIEETFRKGDVYLVPNKPGIIMAVRNAGAFEVIVDGESIGQPGAVGRPLTGLLLDPNTLRPRDRAAGGTR